MGAPFSTMKATNSIGTNSTSNGFHFRNHAWLEDTGKLKKDRSLGFGFIGARRAAVEQTRRGLS